MRSRTSIKTQDDFESIVLINKTFTEMAIIFETLDFLVEAPDAPLVDRNDGGHITITPRVRVTALQDLSPVQAICLIQLMIVVGEAMEEVMNLNGVDIGRIN